jgi:acyl-CoA synthetase (AMP-forming)/AMP-acid ligase II
MGLIGLLCGMVNGVSQYLHLPRSFIANPAAWLREFSRLGATGYTGPNFSYAQMLGSIDDDQAAELDLSRWRIAFNGSEPIDPLVVEQFLSRFSRAGFRPQSMLPVYGLAEATLPVTFPTIGSPPLIQWVDGKRLVEEGVAVQVARTSKLAKGVVSVGKSVLNHMVRIVDPSGTEIPENNVGEIQVKGPAIMSGYYANPEATAAVMRDGWLSTGDLGYVSEDLLFITGRAKEIIIVNGSKFYPEDVEELVRNVNGVYQNRCVAFGYNDGSAEQMIVAAETGLGTDIEKQALVDNLRTLICNQLGLFAVRIHLLKCGGIPRTSSGKYQRLLLRERLEKADSNRE